MIVIRVDGVKPNWTRDEATVDIEPNTGKGEFFLFFDIWSMLIIL